MIYQQSDICCRILSFHLASEFKGIRSIFAATFIDRA
jgi:hypothetical protein